MLSIGLAVGSAVAGGVIAWFIARHFFLKDTTRSLTPYLETLSMPLQHVGEEIRKQLQVSYDGEPVSRFAHVQFIVANDGPTSIPQPEKPLTLWLGQDVSLLDVSVIHQHPDNLDVSYKPATQQGVDQQLVTFYFQRLNPGDYFVVKLLLDGDVRTSDMRFRVLGEGLPNALRMWPLPHDAWTESPEKPKRQLPWQAAVAVGAWAVYVGAVASMGFIIVSAFRSHQLDLLQIGPIDGRMMTAILSLAMTLVVALAVAAVGLGWTIVSTALDSKKPRFRLSKDHPSERPRRFYYFDDRFLLDEDEVDELEGLA